MVEQKTINISVILGMLALLGLSIPQYIPEPDVSKYFCEERPDLGIFECDGFSKYVSVYGKCLNATRDGVSYGNKVCREGWQLVQDDTVIEEPEEPIDEPIETPVVKPSGVRKDVEICTNKGCV